MAYIINSNNKNITRGSFVKPILFLVVMRRLVDGRRNIAPGIIHFCFVQYNLEKRQF